MTHSSSVHLQIASEDRPSVPDWLGEVALVAQVFTTSGVLKQIEQQVRFARARFGTYDLIDFVVVLIGYTISAEATLQAFYERLQPFASAFMALFGRQNLPHRSTLSRFLAALDQPTVEALRTLFLDDLVMRTAQTFPPGGLWDRQGHHWLVIDVDGTKQAARQRALPSLPTLPAPHRRFDHVCAPGYLGRKRGEVARVRTTVLQAHSHQWLGTFGGPGNGDYQAELAHACQAIISYAGWLCMPLAHILIRLDGLYGTGAALMPLFSSGIGVIVRSKEYGLLDQPAVIARLTQPPDAQTTHPESGAQRALFDCPNITLGPSGFHVRLIVATHPTTSTSKPPIGVLRAGIVYELFLTTAPQTAFTCADVLDLYLHRGSFETVLADEDREQDPDRWCSRTMWGQECWQILSQWIWNLRLDLGQHLSPTSLRLTEFAPAAAPSPEPAGQPPATPACQPVAKPVAAFSPEPVGLPLTTPACQPAASLTVAPASESVRYGPARLARQSRTSGFAGSDFVPQPDGSLRCPAGHPLFVHERRPERNGSLRVVYGARIGHCRPCPLRAQCQASATTRKPRQVSAVLWPIEGSPPAPDQPSPPVDVPDVCEYLPSLASPALASALAPVVWGDWPRCQLRQNFIHLLRTQTVELTFRPLQSDKDLSNDRDDHMLTRAERAHWRLSWQQRLARNARPAFAQVLTVTIYGLPAAFAQYIGASLVAAA